MLAAVIRKLAWANPETGSMYAIDILGKILGMDPTISIEAYLSVEHYLRHESFERSCLNIA